MKIAFIYKDHKLYYFLFFLLGFSLPLNDQFNTIIILSILAVSLVRVFIERKFKLYKLDSLFVGIISSILVLRVLGVFYGDTSLALKQLTRSLPILILPVIFFLNRNKNIERFLLYGVITSLMFLFAYLEFKVVKSIFINKETLDYFLRWKYLNYNFVGNLDLHPAYIGLFIVLALYYTLFSNLVSKKLKGIIVLILFIFLFQLVARNAIILALIFFTYFLITLKKKTPIIIYSISIVVIVLSILFHPSNYLRNKFFNLENTETTVVNSNRFVRLKASYEVFKEAPILGVGPGKDNILRKESYLRMNDMVAYNNNYNSHNQFMEFLSTYGLFGFLIFCTVIIFVVLKIAKSDNKKLFLLIFAFAFSCLTESVIERSMGIKYFGLILGIIWWHLLYFKNESNILNGGRP